MSYLSFRTEPDCTADGAPEVNLFVHLGDAMFAVTLTPEETYAQADAMVRAADAANTLAAAVRKALP